MEIIKYQRRKLNKILKGGRPSHVHGSTELTI
jgi:hypothetical protein